MIVFLTHDDDDCLHNFGLGSNSDFDYGSDCDPDPDLCLSLDFCFCFCSDVFDPRYGVPLREKMGTVGNRSDRIWSCRSVSLKE